MKILTLAVLAVDSSDVPLLLHKAFQQLGHESSILSPIDDNSMVQRVIQKSGYRLSYLDLRIFSQRVYKFAKTYAPDILLIYGSNYYILPSFLKKIKEKLSTRILLWEGNIQFWRWFQSEALNYYDLCFVADSHLLPILMGPAQKRHAYLLGAGCDPDEHFEPVLSECDQENYGAEVSFVGSGFPNRIKLFENLTEFDLKLWGRFWDQSPKLTPHFTDQPVYGIRKCKIYSASKISINLQNPISQINGISCRVFEILACGGFPLTENKKDLSLYFDVGKEIVAYDNADDLKKKIRYYLDHPDERAEIARRGRERVLREHTYKHRMQKMLGIINEPEEVC